MLTIVFHIKLLNYNRCNNKIKDNIFRRLQQLKQILQPIILIIILRKNETKLNLV